MSAKMSPQRRAAFFAALKATGNQTIAAERACVSRAWVQLHRTNDPQFRRDLEAAVRQARERLDTYPECRPPSGWGFLDGEELVVRGSGGSVFRDAAGAAPQDERKRGRRIQIARARVRQWTPRVEDRFLATLAATCNVKAALAEVGMTAPSAYAHRKRWPAFALRWDAAIEQGYARIEMALVENGCNLFSTPDLPPEAPMPAMSVDQAIHLLHMHKNQVLGIGGRPGRAPRRPTLDEMRPSIQRKVEAIIRGGGVSEADKARDRAEWKRRRGG